MANILYITPEFYTTKKHTGGMGTKTKALSVAWGTDHNIEIDSELDPEKHEFYDVIIIELLGFRNDNKFRERIEALRLCPVPKLVYGSDSEIFRWTGSELDALKDIVDLWIPNIEWQANYFRDFDLAVTDVVYEPIDCDLFRPSEEQKKIIVAGGAISYQKQSEFFIQLFSELAKMDTGEYKTSYIGGHIWGGKPNPIDMELRHELKQVTDIFHGEISQVKVAAALDMPAIGILNPKYETCNRFGMELCAAGKAQICSKHVCYDERPSAKRFDGTVEDCINKLSILTNEFEELPAKKFGKEAREFALANYSYEASLDSLNEILRRVL